VVALAAALGSAGALVAVGAGPAGALGPTASLSGAEIVSAASTAMAGVSSVTVDGTVGSSAQNIVVAMAVNRGGDAQGTLSLNGSVIKVIRLGPTVYLSTNAQGLGEFGLTTTEEQAFKGRWVFGKSSAQPFAALAPLDQITTLVDSVVGTLHGSSWTKLGTTTVGGRPAVAVEVHGAAEGDETVDVAASGPPYVLKLTAAAKGEAGTIVFTHFDRPLVPKVPAKAVPISSVTGS
jgi:hypothetical protein